MDPNLENLIAPIGAYLGIQPTTFLFYIGLLVMLCNVASRLIPDDKTGFLGWLRAGASWVGLHFPNRISGNITTNDVAAFILASRGVSVNEDRVATAQDKIAALTPDLGGEPMELNHPIPEPVAPKMFAGVGRDPSTGQFVKVESPWFAGLIALFGVLMVLSGCAQQRLQATTYACAHADQIRAADPIARLKVMTIQDPVARQAALAGLDLTLAALATCPAAPTTQPTE